MCAEARSLLVLVSLCVESDLEHSFSSTDHNFGQDVVEEVIFFFFL